MCHSPLALPPRGKVCFRSSQLCGISVADFYFWKLSSFWLPFLKAFIILEGKLGPHYKAHQKHFLTIRGKCRVFGFSTWDQFKQRCHRRSIYIETACTEWSKKCNTNSFMSRLDLGYFQYIQSTINHGLVFGWERNHIMPTWFCVCAFLCVSGWTRSLLTFHLPHPSAFVAKYLVCLFPKMVLSPQALAVSLRIWPSPNVAFHNHPRYAHFCFYQNISIKGRGAGHVWVCVGFAVHGKSWIQLFGRLVEVRGLREWLQ